MLFKQEHALRHGDEAAPCSVSRLRLNNFRNYAQLSLDLSASIVILSGSNGTGKTNLMEAISFLSPGRGLRRARLREVQKADAVNDRNGGWAVAATISGPGGPIKISSYLSKTNKLSLIHI